MTSTKPIVGRVAIFIKGAWVLHTLRYLIGDEAFFNATQQLVYGTDDPKPGNFKPHFADTQDFIDAVNAETEKDMTWFLSVIFIKRLYCELVSNATATNTLHFKSAAKAPFTMPVEIRVGGELRTVVVSKEAKTITLPSNDVHIVLDPESKILRQQDYLDEYSAFEAK